jgi:transcription-repair coupling factor (superfamily II helicase)
MLDRLLTRDTQERVLERVRAAADGGVITSLHGSSPSLIASLLVRDRPGQVLVVAATLDEAEALYSDLATLLPDRAVLHFPELEILPYDRKSPYKGIVGQQVEVLHRLLSGEPCVVVASAKALVWKVLPPEEVRRFTLDFRRGEGLDLEDTVARFAAMGYYAVPRVESPGDFARKGGILDVFSVSYENPVRIELWDDRIESIRFFDATTQRSLQVVEHAQVPPCSLLLLSDDNVQRALQAVGRATHGSTLERNKLADHVAERLHFDGMERYAAYYSRRAPVTDYLAENARILWVRPRLVAAAVQRLGDEIHHLFDECVRAGEPVPPPEQVYATPADVRTVASLIQSTFLSDVYTPGRAPLAPAPEDEAAPAPRSTGGAPADALLERAALAEAHGLTYSQVHGDIPAELLEDIGAPTAAPPPAPSSATTAPPARTAPAAGESTAAVPLVRLDVQAATPFAGNITALQRDLAGRLRLGQRIHIFCDNQGQADRLRELLDEVADQIDFPVGELQSGFVLDGTLVVLTDREIFHRYRKRQRRRKYRTGQGTSAYQDLATGDFVVHVNYGIGRYLGIRSIEVEGNHMDCLELLFADGDKIFVTVDQINMVEKYVGKEGVAPQLTKLGGTSWARAKAKAKNAINEMADELLALAAARQSRPGHAFAPDGHLLKELEASFIYDETPDQLTAIADVKRDMEEARPMDRLLCGDVGYGKTEVAIRAAFKAVQDGKQVAVLVPTTILAHQHLTTFRERFADFPVEVDMLSRLRNAKEARAIIDRLAAGRLDIVIGTHRLLSKDVQFKALGLVVVDEEHRFGVAHKEKLKTLKQTVDVLSMTATPIPRTLNMALSGLRDMSLINTAPRDRLPVQTEILPFDEETITDAILRELDRGGQVYFVHNRVESIEAMSAYIRRLVPQARITIGHGRMDEHVLEKVMLDFIEAKHDILVSTMIIESGLDIPNVNTLLVNRADRMGLAQLYQLRGRVGRSTHKAYAYFMVPRGGQTTDLARKRLGVLQEFESLGSGFKVAMRDLEIRGAGNILGQAQHGHLIAVGFDLYCKLLEQTIAELQGKELAEEVAVRVEVDVDYLIPEAYVPDPEEKMLFYKRLAAVNEPEEIVSLREELVDRYGPMPEEAVALLQVGSLRLAAWQAGLDRVRIRAGRADLWLRAGRTLNRPTIESLVRSVPNKLAFDAARGFKITIHLKEGDRLAQVAAVVEQFAAAAAAV